MTGNDDDDQPKIYGPPSFSANSAKSIYLRWICSICFNSRKRKEKEKKLIIKFRNVTPILRTFARKKHDK
jgi:hypothetical protein